MMQRKLLSECQFINFKYAYRKNDVSVDIRMMCMRKTFKEEYMSVTMSKTAPKVKAEARDGDNII